MGSLPNRRISVHEAYRRLAACIAEGIRRQPPIVRNYLTDLWHLIEIGPGEDGWIDVSHSGVRLMTIDPKWIESDRWDAASITAIPQSLADMPADWLTKEQHQSARTAPTTTRGDPPQRIAGCRAILGAPSGPSGKPLAAHG